jgi:hypothetical protein
VVPVFRQPRKRRRSVPSRSPSPRPSSQSGKSAPRAERSKDALHTLLSQALSSVTQLEDDMPGSGPAGVSPKTVVSTESLLSESRVQVKWLHGGGLKRSSSDPESEHEQDKVSNSAPSDGEVTGSVALIALLKATLLGAGKPSPVKGKPTI